MLFRSGRLAAVLAGDPLLAHCAVVPGADGVLVEAFDTDLDDIGLDDVAVAAALHRATAAVASQLPGVDGATRTIEIPVVWDGPDLPDVAALWGLTEAEVIARLEGIAFTSAFCGFAPGFAYLAGLDEVDAVPRLPDPRPRVPAGSVALAGTWAGVYPSASPGGWRLVGCTDTVLFDVAADPPALLAPGTTVRFVGR